jgi:hypothetical protein
MGRPGSYRVQARRSSVQRSKKTEVLDSDDDDDDDVEQGGADDGPTSSDSNHRPMQEVDFGPLRTMTNEEFRAIRNSALSWLKHSPKTHASWHDISQLKVSHLDAPPQRTEPFAYMSKDLIQRAKAGLSSRYEKVLYNRPSNVSDSKLGTYCQRVTSPDDTTLVFESRFESGNLQKAIQLEPFAYKLILHKDHGARQERQTCQWFYFCVKNTRKNQKYRFVIYNRFKPQLLFVKGMQPLVYSAKKAENDEVGWTRSGEDICFFKTTKKTCTLTFTLQFDHDFDTVFLAMCHPYTYSDMQNHLRAIIKRPAQRIVTVSRLCTTRHDNVCPLVTITDFSSPQSEIDARKVIFTSARVHPGETNSSWIMKGILDFLTSNQPDAVALRSTFVFKLVPMLNPDGVIIGNFRCNSAGLDLNRTYAQPDYRTAPTVFSYKRMVARFKAAHPERIWLCCDLHGHSRAMNIFTYGVIRNPYPSGPEEAVETLFPRFLGEHSPFFSLGSSHYVVRKSKRSSQRVVLSMELDVMAYTLEASYGGGDFGSFQGLQYSSRHFQEMGYYWCQSLLVTWRFYCKREYERAVGI